MNLPARTRSVNSLDSVDGFDARAEILQLRREMTDLSNLRGEMGEIKDLLKSICTALPGFHSAGASTSGTAGAGGSAGTQAMAGASVSAGAQAATGTGALIAPSVPPGFSSVAPILSTGGMQSGVALPQTADETQVNSTNAIPSSQIHAGMGSVFPSTSLPPIFPIHILVLFLLLDM